MPSTLLPLFASLLAQSMVHALRNITIDDSDNMITYTGDWRRSNSILDFGGSHAYTLDPEAQAVVTFIGVGVYFLSPRWPFAITMQLSLDDGPPNTLDLQDYITPFSDGSETIMSQVTWNASGLTNGMHKLRAFPAPSSPYVIMDGLILTVLDDTDTTTDSSTGVGTSPTSMTGGPTQTSSTHAPTSTLTPRKTLNVAAISAASVAGGVAVLAFLAFLLYLHFQQQRKQREHVDPAILGEAFDGTPDVWVPGAPNGSGGGDDGGNGGAPPVSSSLYITDGRELGTSSAPSHFLPPIPSIVVEDYRTPPSGTASLAAGAGSSQNDCDASHLLNSASGMDGGAVPGARPYPLDDLASSQPSWIAGPLASSAVATTLLPRAITEAPRP